MCGGELKTTNLYSVFDVRNDEASAIQAFSCGCSSRITCNLPAR
jgi:hypothetical protein